MTAGALEDGLSRREFLQHSLLAGAGLALAGMGPLSALAEGGTRLTLLHTNDTHSHIDPLPMSDKQFPGLGGYARRATLIKQFRQANPNTLVIDAGDMFQGTPYFNFFKGEPELKGMSLMGYDFATIGNHDFDNGWRGFNEMASNFAKFQFLNANYDLAGTPLQQLVKPYTVRQVGPVKVGLFGLGVKLAGLVAESNYAPIRYQDPVKSAQQMVEKLRRDEKVQLVVAITHLGYSGYHGDVGDVDLAQQVAGIDVIIGGHSHTMLEKAELVKRTAGGETLVAQVGQNGTHLGKIELLFDGKELRQKTGGIYALEPQQG